MDKYKVVLMDDWTTFKKKTFTDLKSAKTWAKGRLNGKSYYVTIYKNGYDVAFYKTK